MNLAIVILAAGRGTRMKSTLPKVCHPIGGLPMLAHVLNTALELAPEQIITVIAPDMQQVTELIENHPAQASIAYQETQEGTGHAVMSGMTALKNPSSDVLVLYGDTPLLQASTLKAMLEHRLDSHADVVVMGMRPLDPSPYGRIFLDEKQHPYIIIEAKDATPEQRKNNLVNSGFMFISGKHREKLLGKLTTNNAQGEYLLTDVIHYAYQAGLKTSCFEGPLDDLLGVNDRIDLARCEADYQNRLRLNAMRNGATLVDPQTVTFCHDTLLGEDVTIQPHVIFGPNVRVERNVNILGFTHIEGAHIKSGCSIGPFARIRPGTVMEEKAKIGNFVEVKNTQLKAGAKVNHLSYIGDAAVGEKTNIGAGTITCNYDGYNKYRTIIGEQVFIGSNTALVAPIEIGDRAIIGAGSVITKTVSADAIAFTRPQQQHLPDAAIRFRQKKTKEE